MARMDFLAVLAKTETTYGVDPVPTGAANAMVFQDVDVTPAEGDRVERPRVQPHFGNRPAHLVARRMRLSGRVDLAGSAARGTPPPWAPLLRACGMSQAANPGTSVVYAPVSTAQESCALFFFLDGTRHRGLGARGNFEIEIVARQVPRFRFDFVALNLPADAAVLPAQTVSAWQEPVPASFAATPTAMIDGTAVALQSLTYRHGQQVALNERIGRRRVEIAGRTPALSALIEAPDALAKDFFELQGGAPIQCSFVHGTVAGNIATLAVRAQVMDARYVNDGGTAMLQLEMLPLATVAGDDEVSLTIT